MACSKSNRLCSSGSSGSLIPAEYAEAASGNAESRRRMAAAPSSSLLVCFRFLAAGTASADRNTPVVLVAKPGGRPPP